MIDVEYLSRLIAFINQRENVRFKIADISTEPPKMVEHLKYYIDYKAPEMMEIEFIGDNYEEFRIMEFFDGKAHLANLHDNKKLKARLWP